MKATMKSALSERAVRRDGGMPYNRKDVIRILTKLIDDEVEDDFILNLAGVWQLNYKGVRCSRRSSCH